MSILFKFVGSSFLLTFGIILLVCGSIMLYSYRRINLLERSVIEHGKILQSFILNYNIQMQSINSLYAKNKFEKEEIDQVNKIKKINLGDKINVSEDECSEDECSEDEYLVDNNNNNNNNKINLPVECVDDDDEDEEGEDDEDEEGEDDDDDDEEDDEEDEDDEDDDGEDEDDKEDEDDDEEEEEELSKLTIQEDNLAKILTVSKKELEKNIKDLGDFEEIELEKPYFSNNDDETFIKNLPVNLDTFNIDLNINSKIINLNNMEISASETVTSVDNGVTKKNYSKMKVDDLKTIAVTRNLIDNETAQKMKKADLIKLIQNA